MRRMAFGVLLALSGSPSGGVEPTMGTVSTRGEGPVGLVRAVLSANAIVEARLLPDGAFLVLRS